MRMGRWRIPCVWPKGPAADPYRDPKESWVAFFIRRFLHFWGEHGPLKGFPWSNRQNPGFVIKQESHQKATLFLKDMKKKCQKNGCSITNLFLQNGSTDSTVYCWSLNLALSNLAFFQYQDRYESMKVIGERQADCCQDHFRKGKPHL